MAVRQYKGEWQDAHNLLTRWGLWHWISKDRGIRGTSASKIWRDCGFDDADFCSDEMDDAQWMIENIINVDEKAKFPKELRKAANLIYCDYPTDSIRFIVRRKQLNLAYLQNRHKELLSYIAGATSQYYYKFPRSGFNV